jgi:DNA-binding NarL/FixJ family response regulator
LHFALKSLRLTVQDNGQGLNPALIEQGDGLGLADLRRQTQALGGTLPIESTPAEGTLVTLTVPLKVSRQDQQQVPVLLVAGQQLIRQGLRMALAESDELTCVGQVADSAAAVRQIELSHPDLVLMDVRLAGQSGIETTRQIIKRFPQVCVIVFSYLPDETYMEQAFQAGAKGFVVLTDDSHAIVDVLHGVLSGQSLVSPSLAEAWARLKARTTVADMGDLVTARERLVDTLMLARRKHPGGSNRLDDLCARYRIDNSKRVKHGALLDAELLAEVYVELIGARQAILGLAAVVSGSTEACTGPDAIKTRPVSLLPRVTEEERAAHRAFVATLGSEAIWLQYRPEEAAAGQSATP